MTLILQLNFVLENHKQWDTAMLAKGYNSSSFFFLPLLRLLLLLFLLLNI